MTAGKRLKENPMAKTISSIIIPTIIATIAATVITNIFSTEIANRVERKNLLSILVSSLNSSLSEVEDIALSILNHCSPDAFSLTSMQYSEDFGIDEVKVIILFISEPLA